MSTVYFLDGSNTLAEMKNFISLIIFAAAVSQISAAKLNITIFYETLCRDCIYLFRDQVYPAVQDAAIKDKIFIEMVPFGKAKYTENPWSITCQNGPAECLGNVMNACFITRNADYFKQVAFVTCCLTSPSPQDAGEKCAQKLGYSYAGVKECTGDKEGISLQIKNGRTLDFKPKITFVPTVVYNNVYNAQDQKESLTNFKAVVLRKLKAMGYELSE